MPKTRTHAARRAIALVFAALTLGTPATIALAATGSQAAPAPAVAPVVIAAPIGSGLAVGDSVHRMAHRVALSSALRSARKLAHARGTHIPQNYVQELRGRSVRGLLRKTHRLRVALRDFVRYGGAPAIAIPAQLAAIANCESHSNPQAIGGGGAFRGKYQFDYGTWASVGGHGDPAAAPEAEQDRRAAMLYARSGASPWPVCGR
jgi:hypothetical protein